MTKYLRIELSPKMLLSIRSKPSDVSLVICLAYCISEIPTSEQDTKIF